MEKCKQCRWWYNELCCNICVDEIKEDCSHFYSYVDSENVRDEYDDNIGLLND